MCIVCLNKQKRNEKESEDGPLKKFSMISWGFETIKISFLFSFRRGFFPWSLNFAATWAESY